MSKRYIRQGIKYIFIFVAVVVFIIYALYQLGFMSDDITVSTLKKNTHEEALYGQCCLFMDETVLYAQNEGAFFDEVSESEHLAKGSVAVTVYSESEKHIQLKLRKAKDELSVLKKSNVGVSENNTEEIDSEITKLQHSVISLTEKGKISEAKTAQEELLILLNKRDIITNKKLNYNEEITALENEISELSKLASEPLEQIITPQAGYYLSMTDGYENIFMPNMLEDITYEEYMSLIKMPAQKSEEKAAGKLLHGQTWYIGCIADKTEIGKFSEGQTFQASFVSSCDTEIQLTFHKALSSADSDKAVLIFSSDTTNELTDFSRFQSIRIITELVEGYQIDSSALRYSDDMCGVYALSGRELRFVPVDITYSGKDYYLINNIDDSEENKLELYDKIVTAGKNLYDGKIIE